MLHRMNTQRSKLEDAVTAAETLTSALYSSGLDGAYASSVEVAPLKGLTGMLRDAPVTSDGRHILRFNDQGGYTARDLQRAFAGHVILSPRDHNGELQFDIIGGRRIPRMFPAIVPHEQPFEQCLRVVAASRPFVGSVSDATGVLLSAELQSRHKEVGSHSRARVGLDAGHFTVLLTTAASASVRNQVAAGSHVVHGWKDQEGIITSASQNHLFSTELGTVHLAGKEPIAWHESLEPYNAALPNGLVIAQGIGYAGVRGSQDAVKRSAEIMQ